MAAVAPIRLADYTPWDFSLPVIALDIDIQSDHVVVSSRLELKPQAVDVPLQLRGVDLTIESLAIDEVPLEPADWCYEAGLLTINTVSYTHLTLPTKA